MSSSQWVVGAIVVDDSACDPDDLSPCGGVAVTVPAGQPWDALVELAVTSGWPGVEALSGVLGTVADVVRANVTAHGQAATDVVSSVRTWDRQTDAQRTFAWADCGFDAKRSRFQELLSGGRERYDILDVSLLFKQGDLTAPITDEDLAERVGATPGERVPLNEVRTAVLADQVSGGSGNAQVGTAY